MISKIVSVRAQTEPKETKKKVAPPEAVPAKGSQKRKLDVGSSVQEEQMERLNRKELRKMLSNPVEASK
jgi:hypothetical protein